MLLNLRYNYLFIHIAKTGGTSIRTALKPYQIRDPYRIPLALTSRLSAAFNHRLGCKFPRHAKAIAAKEMLPGDLFDRLFTFAIVRNPWDLQVSSYHHILRERPHLMSHIHHFDQFLEWKMDPDRPYHYIIDTSMQLQSDYLIDLHGRQIVDFVGHYETLSDDFQTACSRIGIRHPGLPHKRKAVDRKPYRSYYTDRSAEQVARYFKADIDRLGYTF